MPLHFGLTRESLSELQGYDPSSSGADTNGVALGVTPRVLPSVCPAVLVQWRRPRESPVPQRLALDWIFFLPTRRSKDNLFGGLCQDLGRWRIVHRGRTGSWASGWVSLADFSVFVCEVEHDSLALM